MHPASLVVVPSLVLALGLCGCGDSGPPSARGSETGASSETSASAGTETSSTSASTGDGDGEPTTTTGDGDGEPTTTTGDGDGDGDGDPTTTTTTGDGDGEPEPSEIVHIATTEVYDSDGNDVTIELPPGTEPGDLMILVLHRTDSDLPLYVEGWTRVAECFKRDNGYDCSTEEHCTEWHNENFCQTFGGNDGGPGHDLAQSVFVKPAGGDEPASYSFDLNLDPNAGGAPGWAILTTLRGASKADPVRDWSNTGCDQDANSVFPSVYGVGGDYLLMSQSFDDAIAEANFGPPEGATSLGYVSQSDEAGFLFGRLLDARGDTGPMPTTGPGGPNCKDALVTLAIRPE